MENNQNELQTESVRLHFIDGHLMLDKGTSKYLHIQRYMATIYADEKIGEIRGSDAVIGYNEEEQVWAAVKNADDTLFSWDNWDTDRKVTVLFYVLAKDQEYLLYCSNEKFFCYLTIPEKDPRQDRVANIPTAQLDATYHVLDELLQQTNQYSFKVIPRVLEG